MTRIAFLGLGAMGSRMATRLVEAGHDLVVWNRNGAAANDLVARGACMAASPREASQGADIVFSMVTDDVAARTVWLDANDGALAGLKPGAVAIECSTVTPVWVRELSEQVARRGAALLDAPVAGSLPQAEAGQLVFMVGGEAEAIEKAHPALEVLSGRIIHVGAAGQGAVIKLAVNAYFAAQLASMAELLGYLSRNGFDAVEAAELMGQFPVVPAPLAGAAKMMAARSAAQLFTIDMLDKDLGYLLTTAAASGAALPTVAAVRQIFNRAQKQGFGNANISGLAALFA